MVEDLADSLAGQEVVADAPAIVAALRRAHRPTAKASSTRRFRLDAAVLGAPRSVFVRPPGRRRHRRRRSASAGAGRLAVGVRKAADDDDGEDETQPVHRLRRRGDPTRCRLG